MQLIPCKKTKAMLNRSHPLARNLEALWIPKFQTGASTSISDFSKNRTGTFTNTSWMYDSLNFNGSNTYVSIPDHSAFNESAISVVAAVRRRTNVVNGSIISKGFTSVAPPYIQWSLKYDSTTGNTAQFQVSTGGSGVAADTVTDTATTNTGVDVFLGGCYDGENAKIIRDGIVTNTVAASGAVDNWSQPVNIGRWSTGNIQYLDGQIFFAAFYSRSLSNGEWLELYRQWKRGFVDLFSHRRAHWDVPVALTNYNNFRGMRGGFQSQGGMVN